jgi:hypothetical protein
MIMIIILALGCVTIAVCIGVIIEIGRSRWYTEDMEDENDYAD